MIKFFNPAKSYLGMKEEIDTVIQRVLSRGDLILREDVEEFEHKLADFIGTKYAIGLNSGTDALYLALRYLGVGPGDRVLVPSYTFVATLQVVKQLGAESVQYDLDDVPSLNGYKAIIPVHMEGAIDVNAFRHGTVIEDACQALGAEKLEKKAGSIGLAGAFSFYPAKILGCYGDGGALVTNDTDLYEWVKEARNHFKNTNRDWGINSRLDNLQAAILNVKFKYLPQVFLRRREIAQYYLNNLPTEICPSNIPGRVWQDFVIKTANRDSLFGFLKARGVETMKNEYPFPIPKLPKTLEYEKHTLRIPCNETLEDIEVAEVAHLINTFNDKR